MNTIFNDNNHELLYKLDNPEVVINLLKQGFNPNVKNKDNITPFMYLNMFYYNKTYFSKLFKIFIEYGAIDYNNNNTNILLFLLKTLKNNESLYSNPYNNYIELMNILILNDNNDLYIENNNINTIINDIIKSELLMKTFIKKYINKLDTNNIIIDVFIRENLYKILNYFINDYNFTSILLDKLKNYQKNIINETKKRNDVTPIYKIISLYSYFQKIDRYGYDIEKSHLNLNIEKIDTDDIQHLQEINSEINLYKMMELYLKYDIDPNIAPHNHENPLMIAIKHNLYDIIKLLIINKADPFYEHPISYKNIKYPYEICDSIDKYNILMDLYNKYYPNIILSYSFTKSKESYGKIYNIKKRFQHLKDNSNYGEFYREKSSHNGFNNNIYLNNNLRKFYDSETKNNYEYDHEHNSELSDFIDYLSDNDDYEESRGELKKQIDNIEYDEIDDIDYF